MKISMLSLLTIVFIVLKLVGTINWSWWLVLAPSIVGIVLWVLAIVVYAIASVKLK
jgi:hypothetical protein